MTIESTVRPVTGEDLAHPLDETTIDNLTNLRAPFTADHKVVVGLA